jgi:hypothetical protein
MFEENYPETLKRLFVVKGKLGNCGDEAKWEREVKNITWSSSVAHSCNPSYLGG